MVRKDLERDDSDDDDGDEGTPDVTRNVLVCS